MRYDDYIAKLSLAPSPRLTALKGSPVAITGSPNAQRDAVVRYFDANEAGWELRAQLCRDLEKMPVEDASVLWAEDLSPHLPVARLVVPRQCAWSEERAPDR